MAGAPNISTFEIAVIFLIIGVIGWGSIEITLFIIKWIISHLKWIN